jgi:hypothetical protein
MKTVFKIAVGLMLGAVLLIVGCAALIGAGAAKVAHDQERSAATAAQVARIRTGMTRGAVHHTLSPTKPDIVSDSASDGLGSSAIESYNVKDGGRLFGKSVTITYSNGRVIDVTKTDLGG